ncbi:MAG TPA: tetraacyldisaccharide 4'-kinase, partial [Verrucomicrobiae bacterium]|nr:tetraacyldisaccharide 4'-kinase [Verrucomicrobiae bacterium]
ADVVVLPAQIEQLRFAGQIWPVRRQIEPPDAGGKLIAFCGIGRPRQFFDSLRAANRQIAETLIFNDHHSYGQRDIDRLLQLKKQNGADGFITTEKDAINLGAFASQLEPLQSARLRLELESPEQAVTRMLQTLEQRSGCRF